MRTVVLSSPRRLACGPAAAEQCMLDLRERGAARIAFITARSAMHRARQWADTFFAPQTEVLIHSDLSGEPSVAVFERALLAVRDFAPDVIVGTGGGSVLDVAKLVAAMLTETRSVRDVFGIGNLRGRAAWLACLPTTAGTGSEVSPNAILLDEDVQLKKGVISPWLVPDAAYIDPQLMTSMPSLVTAGTGMDALTHCIEAYANRGAHLVTDALALDGIRMISHNLLGAISHPADLDARQQVACGSLMGGLCLGPVNTAAVHALSYPLGGRFHVPHGIANALLLPHVLSFNLPAAPERYAQIAIAMGVKPRATSMDTARAGIAALSRMAADAGIPMQMSAWNVPEEAVEDMARAALEITRLLKNNPREIKFEDAVSIYRSAFSPSHDDACSPID